MLSHPNVIGNYGRIIKDKELIISMEYSSGGSLADYLQRQTSPLPEKEVSFCQTYRFIDELSSFKKLYSRTVMRHF